MVADGCRIDRTTNPPVISFPAGYNAVSDFIDCHLESARAERTAIIDGNGSYTYGELANRVNHTGNALIKLGLSKGDRVAMVLTDTIDFPSVFWGCIKTGLVPIPLNTMLAASDYKTIFKDCGARALVASYTLIENLESAMQDSPCLDQVVIAGNPDSSYASLTQIASTASPDLLAVPANKDDIAFWLYSSGSTGIPKGVMHRHSHLVQTAVLYGTGILGMNESDVVFSAAKLFFAYGLGNAMSFPFLVGATTVLLAERPAPDVVMNIIQDQQPTIFYGVPSLFAGILANPELRPVPGSHRLRICVSAGEALPEEIGRQCQDWFGVPVLDGIGSTEMLHIFLSNRMGDVNYGTSGKPVPGYEVKLVDEEGQDAGSNEIGELLVNGPSTASAYWNQPEKSRQVFRDKWTYTGDKYTEDKDGYFHYCGRTDDMLKVSGQWVSPFEVESVIIQHPLVTEAAVIGMEDENKLLKPKAYIVLNAEVDDTESMTREIQDFVKSRMAMHKYPRWIEFIDALPKTATGKIQRFKLRK